MGGAGAAEPCLTHAPQKTVCLQELVECTVEAAGLIERQVSTGPDGTDCLGQRKCSGNGTRTEWNTRVLPEKRAFLLPNGERFIERETRIQVR